MPKVTLPERAGERDALDPPGSNLEAGRRSIEFFEKLPWADRTTSP
jgi:hypothetical protein